LDVVDVEESQLPAPKIGSLGMKEEKRGTGEAKTFLILFQVIVSTPYSEFKRFVGPDT
jgi:hypothetical protein